MAGEQYLRVSLTALEQSEAWRGLKPAEKAEALRLLVISALDGEIPTRWRNIVQLRQVGVKPKGKQQPSKYTPFYSAWEALWEEHRQHEWKWDETSRGKLRAAYVKAEGSLDLFKARALALLNHPRDWYRDQASPGALSRFWNELGGAEPRKGNRPPPEPEMCSKCKAQGVSLMRQDGDMVCLKCY